MSRKLFNSESPAYLHDCVIDMSSQVYRSKNIVKVLAFSDSSGQRPKIP